VAIKWLINILENWIPQFIQTVADIFTSCRLGRNVAMQSYWRFFLIPLPHPMFSFLTNIKKIVMVSGEHDSVWCCVCSK
jgi:hypothetical protein